MQDPFTARNDLDAGPARGSVDRMKAKRSDDIA
jgi:hypothetical protein